MYCYVLISRKVLKQFCHVYSFYPNWKFFMEIFLTEICVEAVNK